MSDKVARIYFCPRFHVNFYHSYRGDTPDENGFGKDIRVIRGILDDLDALEAEGTRLRCAWDFDGAFTLGGIIPKYAPDLLQRIARRVADGTDEVELMSWNNGLLVAHTEEELRLAIGWAISSPDHTGVLDVFGSYAPIARPQECMFSGSHAAVYREIGVEALSIYYSAVPFNGFGSFVPKLPAHKRFNPLTLRDSGSKETIALLPACNQGDIAENWFSLSRMLRAARNEQMRMEAPADMIVILDMDADDTFWAGFAAGFARRLVRKALPAFGGLFSLVKSVESLPFLAFQRPWDYLRSHEPAGSIELGQDMADGAFDGLSSWAEKAENYELWGKILRAREAWERAKSVLRRHFSAADGTGGGVDWKNFLSWGRLLEPKLRSLAESAIRERLLALSTTHFGMAAPVMNSDRLVGAFKIADEAIRSAEDLARGVEYRIDGPANRELDLAEGEAATGGNAKIRITRNDFEVSINPAWVDYAGKRRTSPEYIEIRRRDVARVGGVFRDFSLFVAEVDVAYPKTEHRNYDRAKSMRLSRTWDGNWRQTAPFEVVAFDGIQMSRTVRVWKENFSGAVSSYPLDYSGYGGNHGLASINNHATPSWIALSDGDHGVFLSQSFSRSRGFAFCPMRQRIARGRQTVSLNPFGTYWGAQYRYPASTTGFGRLAAIATADHLKPLAPSWEGVELRFSLLVALYDGDRPPDGLLREASGC